MILAKTKPDVTFSKSSCSFYLVKLWCPALRVHVPEVSKFRPPMPLIKNLIKLVSPELCQVNLVGYIAFPRFGLNFQCSHELPFHAVCIRVLNQTSPFPFIFPATRANGSDPSGVNKFFITPNRWDL